MGCFSSKNNSDEQLKSGTESKSEKVLQKQHAFTESLWDTKTDRCTTDDDFANVVMEALRFNFDLITADEFKTYISSRYLCEADESFQNEIIHKIIGEQFIKGSLAIKPI